MPIYQYRCTSCFTILERRQSFDDAPLTECPACRGDLRRVLNPSGIIFKGSGWYCTDSRSKVDGDNSTGTASAKKEPAGASAKAATA